MRRVTDMPLRRGRNTDSGFFSRLAPPPRRRRPAARKTTRAPHAGERSGVQRRRLLEASAEVFAHGFGTASVGAIVKKAGMSRRTFYEHFDDLTDALLQLYDAAARVLLDGVVAAYRTQTDPRAALEAALEAYVLALSTQADLARIVYGEIRAAGPSHALRHQATLDRFAALLEQWAVAARKARLIRKVPDGLTVHATLCGVEGAAMRHVYLGEERKLRDASPALAEFVLAAFR